MGHFIALANEEKFIEKVTLRQDIKNLIDLIKIRIKEESIDVVANGLLRDFFDLRLHLIVWLGQEKKKFSDYLGTLNVLIADYLQLSQYSDLSEMMVSVLQAHEKIVAPIMTSLAHNGSDWEKAAEEISTNKPTYEGLLLMTLHHPSPRVQYMKNCLDASLQWEIGMILSDLILMEKVKMSKKRIKTELIPFLYDSIVRFGAYSIFTHAWQPDIEDRSPLVNSMKILAATIEMDHKQYHRITKDELYKFLQN